MVLKQSCCFIIGCSPACAGDFRPESLNRFVPNHKRKTSSLQKIMKLTSKFALSAVALMASATLVTAQDDNGGRRRGGGNFDPEQFRQRMEERLKESLKVSGEEWTALQPLIEKVTTKQRESMSGRFGGFGRGRDGGGGGGGGNAGGGGGGGGGRSERAGSAESEALRTAIESESTSPEDLKAKLAAVRAIRKKAADELAAAREDLKKVVTVRQEAVLVSMGILE